MEPTVVHTSEISAQEFLAFGSRPMRANKRTGQVQIRTSRGLWVNSVLTKDEWESMERRVYQAASLRLNLLNLLRGRGLVISEDLGTVVSQWNIMSEISGASESITGQAVGERARLDTFLKGVTVPIIFKEFIVPTRQLSASRKMGNPIDGTTAAAAARVVAEKIESHIVDGSTSQLNSSSITYGLTNHPQRKTDTAANYGGGDWGTIANVVPTVTGMINAVSTSANRYHGPYLLLVAPVQYNQAATSFYTDGSGESALNRVMRIPQVEDVLPNDTLADGEVVLVQVTEDVIDYVEEMSLTVLEWMSPDGMIGHFKVMAAGAPRVKADYDNRTGIVHATAA